MFYDLIWGLLFFFPLRTLNDTLFLSGVKKPHAAAAGEGGDTHADRLFGEQEFLSK